ncbi:V-type ATP synthase subunit E [Chloroflexota bacterium]
MSEMGKISEAILDKVKTEAAQIIKEAEEKALEEIENAGKQMEIRFEKEKQKVVEEAEREATRILAEASVKARQEITRMKADVIDKIISKVQTNLKESSTNESSLFNLTKESIDSLGANEVRIHVSPKDISIVKNLLKSNKELSDKVKEIKEYNCSGGVIAEGIDGKLKIDNTYDTRLEMLLPQILPEIEEEFFNVN